jgi:HPt (histidine-containing phosphotransfer) domain-containing protein
LQIDPRTFAPVPLNPASADWIPWMPSPPLVPDEGFIDTAHLDRMTLGDEALQREVLSLFVRQSADLVARMATFPADMAAMVHTLKGSARGIGAFSAAASAERLERSIEQGGAPAAYSELREAISGTVRAIDDILRA